MAHSPNRFVLAYPQAKVSHDLYMLVPDKVQGTKWQASNGPSHPSTMATEVQDETSTEPLWTQRCQRDMVQSPQERPPRPWL